MRRKLVSIKSLEAMEKIVAANKDLRWDGWTVVHYRYNPVAWRKTNGRYFKNKWYTTTRYVPGKDGWQIPKNLVRSNG